MSFELELSGIDAESALATYGDMTPGGPDAHALSQVGGQWWHGIVRGWQVELDWGPAARCEGIVLDPSGNHVPVLVVVSDRLGLNWDRLDRFQGEGFRRRTTEVELRGRMAAETTGVDWLTAADQAAVTQGPTLAPGVEITASIYEVVTDGQ